MHSNFREGRGQRRLMAEINVVPYIDVTLVLLIIFMVTAPIVQQAVTVQLPQTPQVTQASGNQSLDKPFVITVTEDGLYQTSEAPNMTLTQEEIGTLVAEVMARVQLNQTLEVYLQGDRQAPYGRVVHLFTLLKANGVDNVKLMTQPEAP